jgi:hypothetical protein
MPSFGAPSNANGGVTSVTVGGYSGEMTKPHSVTASWPSPFSAAMR